MIAISWVSVDDDGRGGAGPDPLVWDRGSGLGQRKVDVRVNVDFASFPGPPGFFSGPWVQVHCGGTAGADVAAWPNSVSLLCAFSSFSGHASLAGWR